ncbi:MAG: hypothetical protein V8R40_03240 [Dysosmobacter sp.]
MNAQSNALEYAMKRNGIPYKVVGGMTLFRPGGGQGHAGVSVRSE